MSTVPPDAATPEVYQALNDLGLLYSRRATPRGVPYAGFRLLDGHGESVSLTLLLEDGVVRLTVHRVDFVGNARAMLEAGARLALGALYRAPEDGSTELSLAIRLGGTRFGAAQLEPLLAYATASLAALARGPVPPLPALARDVVPGDPWTRLAGLGHRLRPLDESDAFALTLDLGQGAHAELSLGRRSDAWLEVLAQRSPPCGANDARADPLLHELQRWARCGRFVLSGTAPSAQLSAQVCVPDLGQAAESMQWACSQAVAMLQVAYQRLHTAASG